jgi:2',3'-cyclic-nucleotide 2'-phosphodiesterase (5'-nucleotidase family)
MVLVILFVYLFLLQYIFKNNVLCEVIFIQTTDIHGYQDNWGEFYSFVYHMKEIAYKKKIDIFLIDSGDTHDGNALCDITDIPGNFTQTLYFDIPYDLLTIGNHELYNSMIVKDVYENFSRKWGDKYLTTNVFIKVNNSHILPIGSRYKLLNGKYGTNMLAFGFLYNFKEYSDGVLIKPVKSVIKSKWFIKTLLKYKVDIIIIVAHMPLHSTELFDIINSIRNQSIFTPIIFFGGHTHINDYYINDKLNTIGIQSGKYMNNIGLLSILLILQKNHI